MYYLKGLSLASRGSHDQQAWAFLLKQKYKARPVHDVILIVQAAFIHGKPQRPPPHVNAYYYLWQQLSPSTLFLSLSVSSFSLALSIPVACFM